MGDPLHVLHEFNVVAAHAHAKFVDVAIGRLAILVRPFPPWPLELFSQRLEAGKARQQRTTLLPECLELPPSLAQAIRLETRERKLQHRPLPACHGRIVDQLILLFMHNRGAGGGIDAREFRDCGESM